MNTKEDWQYKSITKVKCKSLRKLFRLYYLMPDSSAEEIKTALRCSISTGYIYRSRLNIMRDIVSKQSGGFDYE